MVSGANITKKSNITNNLNCISYLPYIYFDKSKSIVTFVAKQYNYEKHSILE